MKNAILYLLFLLIPISQAAQQGWTPNGIFTDAETDMNFSDFAQIATPANPSSGRNRLYFKSNNNLYSKTSAGVETQVGAGTVTTVSASTPLASSGGATPNLTCAVASGSLAGCLSSTDWNTFNGKQSAGSYITDLTGDVTASGPGSAATTLANTAVSPGSYTATNLTVDSKGRITAASTGTTATPGANHIVYVDKSGNDTTGNGSILNPYLTINKALASITTATTTDRYQINVGPGTFAETTVALKPFVWITGTGFTNTRITTTGGNVTLDSAFTSTAGRTGMKSVVLSGTNGINLDAASLGGSGQVIAVMEDVQIGGSMTFAGRSGNIDQISFYNCAQTNTGSVSIDMSSVTVMYDYFINSSPGNLSITESLGGPEFAQLLGGYVAGNVTTSATLSTMTVDIRGSVLLGTLTVGAGSVVRSDPGSLPLLTSSITRTGTLTVYSAMDLINGALAATNTVLAYKNGHIKSTQTTVPTATVNANAGTGATCTVSNATDNSGTINLTTTATAPSTGVQCAVNFNVAYNVAPICVFSPANSNAALFAVSSGANVTSSTSVLNMNFGASDIIGHAYAWNYNCIETQ